MTGQLARIKHRPGIIDPEEGKALSHNTFMTDLRS